MIGFQSLPFDGILHLEYCLPIVSLFADSEAERLQIPRQKAQNPLLQSLTYTAYVCAINRSEPLFNDYNNTPVDWEDRILHIPPNLLHPTTKLHQTTAHIACYLPSLVRFALVPHCANSLARQTRRRFCIGTFFAGSDVDRVGCTVLSSAVCHSKIH